MVKKVMIFHNDLTIFSNAGAGEILGAGYCNQLEVVRLQKRIVDARYHFVCDGCTACGEVGYLKKI